MSCEHLVCAMCAGPVIEGRCRSCRAARADVHHSPFELTPQIVAMLALLVATLVLLAQHFD